MPFTTTYPFKDRTKLIFNDQGTSDVIFEVGDSKSKKIFAHKIVLSMASEVFNSMFYGPCKDDCSEPILINDLTIYGFFSMLKYIYGDDMTDLDSNRLTEVYKAADKYLIDNLKEDLAKFIKQTLDLTNVFIIYEQIKKIDEKDNNSILKNIKDFIRLHTTAVFNSDAFTSLDQDTLIEILSMDELTMNEADILMTCSKWVNAEVLKQKLEPTEANKLLISKPIKNYIKFCDSSIDRLISVEHLKGLRALINSMRNLLTKNEIAELLYHFHDKTEPFSIEFKAKRTFLSPILHHVEATPSYANGTLSLTALNICMCVNRKFTIKRILTSIGSMYSDRITFKCSLLNYNETDLILNFKSNRLNNYCCFDFEDGFQVTPKSIYKFKFTFPTIKFQTPHQGHSHLMDTTGISLVDNGQTYAFRLIPFLCTHSCIKGFDFFAY